MARNPNALSTMKALLFVRLVFNGAERVYIVVFIVHVLYVFGYASNPLNIDDSFE